MCKFVAEFQTCEIITIDYENEKTDDPAVWLA